MSPTCKKNISGAAKVATVVLVISLGLWGCARKPSEPAGHSDRVRSLEGRCVKLEQDYRTVALARDKARRELAALEQVIGRLQREVAGKGALIKERDELRKTAVDCQLLSRQLTERTSERDELQQQLTQRLGERDTAVGRYDRLRKGLQHLMTQDDPLLPSPTMTGPNAGPVGPTIGNAS